MSKPRYKWWGYVKAVLRAYPEHKRELESMKQSKLTASYEGSGYSGGVSKPVEGIALRQLSKDAQREYEAVENALRAQERFPDAEGRLKLLDMVFFRKTHTLQGAAVALYVSYSTAKRWHNKAIESVAVELGLLHLEPKKPKDRVKI